MFQPRLPCYLSKGALKGDFLDIYLSMFFGVRKFKNTSSMRVILFLEMFKIESKFTKWKKKLENIFRFWDNCIWICCYKLSLLRREYLLSAVNKVTNSQIFHITQRDFSTWIAFTGINKYGKGAPVQILKVFCVVYYVTCPRYLTRGTF